MALSAIELRVLGALMEKERTTPDGYPLSAQALVTACNQKTSREPVTDHHLQDVLATVQRLQDKGLVAVVRSDGERVPKHRHRVAEALKIDPAEAAVLAVLMLRGAQTPGELRTRTERYQRFADPAAVEAVLERLAARPVPLARKLGRAAGQSQDRWEHCLGQDESRLKPRLRSGASEPAPDSERRAGGGDDAPEHAGSSQRPTSARLDALEARVAELELRLSRLERGE